MEKPQSKVSFAGMALIFKVRDLLKPRKNVLKEAGIQAGFNVLDFGCGPGGYIRPLSQLIGASGKIYALDVNPIALESVKAIVKKNALGNVTTILSDGSTGLPDDSFDMVLFYDVLHHISRPEDNLAEFHRILKAGGILSVSDHHMEKPDIEKKISATGLFRPLKKGDNVYNFSRV